MFSTNYKSMNTNYAEQIVTLACANFDNPDKVKLLDQEERRVILQAFDYLKRPERDRANDEEYMIDYTRIESLKRRIQDKASAPLKPEQSNFIIRFFEGFANSLFGRVSAEKLYQKIHDAKGGNP